MLDLIEVTEFVLWFKTISFSPFLDGIGIEPLCFEEDVLLKICEFDRTDELFGCKLAGFVAFAIRLFEARDRLLSTKVKFELAVALTEELIFSG